MPEMILPGTYIEVRAEKLISAGPIAIGNVGIVGTARRGKLANPVAGANAPDPVVYTPANIGEARDIFGDPDPLEHPLESTADGVPRELTLIRAMELVFANGAQRIFAARIADSGAAKASLKLPADTGNVVLEAFAPGDGYNAAKVDLKPGAVDADDNPTWDVTIILGIIVESWRSTPISVAEFVQTINGKHPTYNYRALSSTGGGSDLFSAAADEAATGNVQALPVPDPPDPPDPLAPTGPQPIGVADGDKGANGAIVGKSEIDAGLDALVNQDVHIVVLAGEGVNDDANRNFGSSLTGHVENASSDLMRRERIGIIGSDPSGSDDDLTENVLSQDEGRITFVGPGLKTIDTATDLAVTLSGTYTAAAVAGRISSLDPHASPTNKTINANGLETEFNGTELEQLVLGRVLALEERLGSIRIVRGITSSANTAWAQVTTRRIVDYARYGVRSAANPFIGKLNNERVREALKGSINGFLADMVDREMLISYELDVSATRAQQIRGIAQVTMVVRPTFSIDYIRVIMYLE